MLDVISECLEGILALWQEMIPYIIFFGACFFSDYYGSKLFKLGGELHEWAVEQMTTHPADEADLRANELGIQFYESLKSNPNALPSDILNRSL
jgi:hypothetical protein